MKYLLIAVAVLVALGALATAIADLEEGLVVYFSFDQGKTDLIEDLSDAGNNGVVHGDPEWVQGPKAEFGQAIQLDGVNDYIEVPDNDTMDVGDDDITMMLWVRHSEGQVDYPRVISKMPLFGTNGPGFDVLTVGAKQATLAIFYGMSGSREEVHAGQDIADGEWHHLVALKEENEGRIYLDGELKGNAPLTPMDISNDFPFIVGGNAEPAAHTLFKGAVDEAAFYNRALTEDEIKEAMLRRPSLSVDSGIRLTTTWGKLKAK